MFSVKMGNNLKASSFKKDTALYIDPNQILPLSRFLPKPPVQKTLKKTGMFLSTVNRVCNTLLFTLQQRPARGADAVTRPVVEAAQGLEAVAHFDVAVVAVVAFHRFEAEAVGTSCVFIVVFTRLIWVRYRFSIVKTVTFLT